MKISSLLKYIFYTCVWLLVFTLIAFFLNTHPPKIRSQITPANYHLPYEAVKFHTQDGLTLSGWLIKGRKNAATIIVGHGYPFDKGNMLPAVVFLYPDYNLFLFDFRSFGENKGSLTTGGAREINDYRAALQYLTQRSDIRPVFGAYGFSFGGSVFLMAAAPEVKAMVIDSPYASLSDAIAATYRVFGPFKWPLIKLTELYAKLFYGIQVRDYQAKIIAPTLLIHNEYDDQLSADNSRKIYNRYKKWVELWILPGSGHGTAYANNPKEYQRRVKAFFARFLQ